MGGYRENWFNVGAVLAVVIAGFLALSHRRLSRPRLFSALNLAALMVHQFEEYGFPGYFPGMMNGGIFKRDKPDRYPLNTDSAMIANTVLGYPFYVLPVLFPKRRAPENSAVTARSREHRAEDGHLLAPVTHSGG